MKLSFIYNADDEYWKDGLWKAIEVISEKWEVKKFNLQGDGYTNYFADFALVWGAFGSPQEKLARSIPFKKGICVAGGVLDSPGVPFYDLLFVENKWYQREFKKRNVDTKIAFGTNTELFYNMNLPERPIDRIYPAAFAAWKRHDRFINQEGFKLAVGHMQDNEQFTFQECFKDPNTTALPMVKPEVLAYLYNQSKTVSIMSDIMGGGERAVLEGLACGCNVEVGQWNPKLVEILEEQKARVSDHVDYAEALMRGIKEVVGE